MTPLIPVMAGGAIGAALRYLTGLALPPRAGWPLGTLTVNIIGGLAMGLLAAAVMKGQASEAMRLFAGVGILGGFTTFSAFSLEGFRMLDSGQWGLAISYAAVSVIASIGAVALGFALVRV